MNKKRNAILVDDLVSAIFMWNDSKLWLELSFIKGNTCYDHNIQLTKLMKENGGYDDVYFSSSNDDVITVFTDKNSMIIFHYNKDAYKNLKENLILTPTDHNEPFISEKETNYLDILLRAKDTFWWSIKDFYYVAIEFKFFNFNPTIKHYTVDDLRDIKKDNL